MANWLIRSTKKHILRRSPAKMAREFGGSFVGADGNAKSNAIAIYQPDLSAVTGFDSKYWEVIGDVISLMNQEARDSIDSIEISNNRDVLANNIDSPESYEKAFALVVLDEINLLRANAGLPTRSASQLKTAVRNKMDV